MKIKPRLETNRIAFETFTAGTNDLAREWQGEAASAFRQVYPLGDIDVKIGYGMDRSGGGSSVVINGCPYWLKNGAVTCYEPDEERAIDDMAIEAKEEAEESGVVGYEGIDVDETRAMLRAKAAEILAAIEAANEAGWAAAMKLNDEAEAEEREAEREEADAETE